MITIECIIPRKYHRTVMGAKGCKIQSVTAEFDVQIKIPDRDTYGMETKKICFLLLKNFIFIELKENILHYQEEKFVFSNKH